MNKIAVVARSEFGTAIRSKGFIIGLLMAPLMTTISIVVQVITEKHVDVTERQFAVVDRTGKIAAPLLMATQMRSKKIDEMAKPELAKFKGRVVDPGEKSPDDVRLELSDEIRAGKLFAFAEFSEETSPKTGLVEPKIVYYSDTPSYRDLLHWIEQIANVTLKEARYAAAGITDPLLVAKLEARVEADQRGLLTRTPSGEIEPAKAVNVVLTFIIPAILMGVMFFIVMSSSPQLLNGVLEEKMSRISEVLLGSVTPFQLMMGKLVSSVGISGLLAALYLSGGYALAAYHGYADAVPPSVLAWFIVYLLLAVFLFGSMFIAIGSACTELKDAQTLMTPAMLIIVMPMFAWTAVIKSPDSAFAVAASLFPLSAPTLMLLRLTLQPAPPLWQVALSLVICAATTVLFVWAAGKIFRTGILMQGKAASFREMLRWVVAK